MSVAPRIALIAFRLESNGHAPVIARTEFETNGYLCGQDILDDLARPAPMMPTEFSGFVDTMNGLRAWEPVPIASANGSAAGPVEQAFFEEFVADVRARLTAAGPVDAVFFAQHGAATATVETDPDGVLFKCVRDIVGPDIPMATTFDLHANVSLLMTDTVDYVASYLTNPHVDQFERGAEAAEAIHAMLGGRHTAVHRVQLPLIPPSIAQNTKSGPYADHIAFGQTFIDDTIANVSICSGFSLGDTVKNGLSVTVTAWNGDAARAQEVATTIAERIWSERERYLVKMTPLDEAVAMMKVRNADASMPSLLFADVADNPGGGGRGNTPYILKAFLEAECRDIVVAPFFDPDLAAEAFTKGEGAEFVARFNRAETTTFSEPMEWKAKVVRLRDKPFVGRRGIRAGRTIDLGPTAVLACDGVRVVVISHRNQFLDPAILESLDIAMDEPRGLVVKSRGHFRAAVDETFSDDRIIEVDVPGLTTPALHRVPYRNVKRPIYPLDPETEWSPTAENDFATPQRISNV